MTSARIDPSEAAPPRTRPLRERLRPLYPYGLMSPITVFYVIALLVPFAMVVVTSFRAYDGSFTVGGFAGLDNFHEFITGPGQRTIIVRTVRIAATTTLATLLLGFPAAHATLSLTRRARSLVMMGLLAPLLTSIIARTFGWWTMLGPGAFGNWLGGLFGRDTSLLFTETAVIIGMINVFLPFMIIPIVAALQNIDPSLRRAARSLGASSWGVIRRVDLPLSMHGIIGGVVIVMSLSLSSFVTPSLLGGSRNDVVATQIFRIGTTYFNRPLSAAGSVLLAGVAVLLVFVNLWLGDRSAARRIGMV